MVRNDRKELPVDEEIFKKVVKAAVSQRRKTLRNSLRTLFPEGYDFSDPIFTLRAERLDVEDYIRLTQDYIKTLPE